MEAAAIDERIKALVTVRMKVAGGPWFIELGELLSEPVCLGPYENPATAKEEAARLTEYLQALALRFERQPSR